MQEKNARLRPMKWLKGNQSSSETDRQTQRMHTKFLQKRSLGDSIEACNPNTEETGKSTASSRPVWATQTKNFECEKN